MYGPHLIIDAKSCNKEAMMNMALIHQFMDELPELIGMEKLFPPYLINHKDKDPTESGISVLGGLKTSHLSIHMYPEKDYFFFDIFSCKPFDTDKVIQLVKETFDVKEMDINIIERGKDFPR